MSIQLNLYNLLNLHIDFPYQTSHVYNDDVFMLLFNYNRYRNKSGNKYKCRYEFVKKDSLLNDFRDLYFQRLTFVDYLLFIDKNIWYCCTCMKDDFRPYSLTFYEKDNYADFKNIVDIHENTVSYSENKAQYLLSKYSAQAAKNFVSVTGMLKLEGKL